MEIWERGRKVGLADSLTLTEKALECSSNGEGKKYSMRLKDVQGIGEKKQELSLASSQHRFTIPIGSVLAKGLCDYDGLYAFKDEVKGAVADAKEKHRGGGGGGFNPVNNLMSPGSKRPMLWVRKCSTGCEGNQM